MKGGCGEEESRAGKGNDAEENPGIPVDKDAMRLFAQDAGMSECATHGGARYGVRSGPSRQCGPDC